MKNKPNYEDMSEEERREFIARLSIPQPSINVCWDCEAELPADWNKYRYFRCPKCGKVQAPF